jgi:hypothetical protein
MASQYKIKHFTEALLYVAKAEAYATKMNLKLMIAKKTMNVTLDEVSTVTFIDDLEISNDYLYTLSEASRMADEEYSRALRTVYEAEKELKTINQ